MVENKKYTPKKIYCPKCGCKALTWDGRSRSYPSAPCLKCRKLIVYKPDVDEIVVSDLPERKTSSGGEFY